MATFHTVPADNSSISIQPTPDCTATLLSSGSAGLLLTDLQAVELVPALAGLLLATCRVIPLPNAEHTVHVDNHVSTHLVVGEDVLPSNLSNE